MKVFLGPYTNWVGPYQIANWLQVFGVSEDRCHELGEKLSKTWVNDACQWIENRKKRKIKVRIDRYDTWNIDSTLSFIMVPLLKQLHATKHGAPFVDDEDVPEHLRSTACAPKENEWDTDENHFKRFDWLLEELIWTFEQLSPDCDGEQKFYSGTHDWDFVPIEGSEFSEMKTGPNDTFKVDFEGLNAYKARIQKGCELFGKYLQGLWD